MEEYNQSNTKSATTQSFTQGVLSIVSPNASSRATTGAKNKNFQNDQGNSMQKSRVSNVSQVSGKSER